MAVCAIMLTATAASADDSDTPQSLPQRRPLAAVPVHRDPLRRAAAAPGTAAEKPATLADPDWVAVPEQSADPLLGLIPPAKNRPHRWRNERVEAISQPADHRPDLVAALSSADPITATNAGILLARAGDPAAIGPLFKAIEAGDG